MAPQYERIGNGEVKWQRDDFLFYSLFIAAQIFGILTLALITALMILNGGFVWSAKHVFNYHPFFLVFGLVVLYGEAIMAYRAITYVTKYPVKVAHGLLQLVALIFSIIGIVAVFQSHIWGGYTNMYSIHSWLGMTTVVLFGLQWIVAFAVYFLPCASQNARVWLMPIHRGMGLAIFVMAVATVFLGLTEQNQFTKKYAQLGQKVMLANLTALFSGFFLAVVMYIAVKPEWKRPHDAVLEEERIKLRG